MTGHRGSAWATTAVLGVAAVLGVIRAIRPAAPAPEATPVEAADQPATPKHGDVWDSPDGRPMVRIERGEFLMGSPASEADRSETEARHRVLIPIAFWLDTLEVDHAAYRRFVLAHAEWQPESVRAREASPSGYLRDWTGTEFPTGLDRHPVTSVTWTAARAYCAAFGKRLPYEPEWEYAARAGTTTAYWWGDGFDGTRANNRLHTEPVGDPSRRNPWGLYDMLGNVWEWTESLDMPYPYRSADGRQDTASEGERTIRGGSWFLAPQYQRAAFRGWSAPGTASDMVGFRCAASPGRQG